MGSISPPEDELKVALQGLRAQNPTLGVTKLHARLLSEHPDWTVSEKRTRKILQNEGLVISPDGAASSRSKSGTGNAPYPTSAVIEGLDVSKWTSKIQVKYFGKHKGKGLVATERIAEGEVVWKEDPFILAPEWSLYDLQTASVACTHCSTPLNNSPLAVPCSGSAKVPSCSARFCNRLCLSRAARTHPLLCPAQNPAALPLLEFARRHEWMALHALAQCTARVLLAEQQDEAAFSADWAVLRGLAQLGMEERAKGGWLGSAEPDRDTWKKAYELFVRAFKDPGTESEKKRLARLLRKPTRKEVDDEIFGYDAFLRGLGRMSLNLEAHGGLYVLHSHVNHSCTPNLSARHLDQRSALSRITVVVRRDIEVGEELFISYVNPDLPLEGRRRQLLEWGFGTCQCPRCVMEEQDPTRQTPLTKSAPGDLEQELKAGLGIM
ncbi:uncharacterized protein PHACADRAFT_148986 [Phanerochaete carnosa HHB-10118-sp]|uniref:Histone-lysine N-methyltransferase SET5 n=1 Tax=Phanerochaete carnosa (strain HHB-10118-sp) TaxID=650164 RepID=K5W0J7_PHACS|nr:uncharacterized protein PHACADRAFT_148986 [Phanerochaete carnosa HHB-10118-sp]EKM52389.1 hypothetical protein PHACADRAFT_148986 [Phanerochaete carnosa HHB-10118-sp]